LFLSEFLNVVIVNADAVILQVVGCQSPPINKTL